MTNISNRPCWLMPGILAVGLALTATIPTPVVAGELSGQSLAKETVYGQYGGPFTLIDDEGRTVTDIDFHGRYLLVFFGYTFCPDVCPTAMQTVSDAMDLLGVAGKPIQPLFISVDPDRDTPKVLNAFVSNFHPKILGLTGTKKQILAIANDYGVKYYKVFTPPSFDDTQEEGDGNEYSVSHSAATYLMGPDGKFITYFAYETPPAEMAKRIRETLK